MNPQDTQQAPAAVLSKPHRKHERIWLLPHDGEQVCWCDHDASEDGEGQEYVRADLIEAQAQAIAAQAEEIERLTVEAAACVMRAGVARRRVADLEAQVQRKDAALEKSRRGIG